MAGDQGATPPKSEGLHTDDEVEAIVLKRLMTERQQFDKDKIEYGNYILSSWKESEGIDDELIERAKKIKGAPTPEQIEKQYKKGMAELEKQFKDSSQSWAEKESQMKAKIYDGHVKNAVILAASSDSIHPDLVWQVAKDFINLDDNFEVVIKENKYKVSAIPDLVKKIIEEHPGIAKPNGSGMGGGSYVTSRDGTTKKDYKWYEKNYNTPEAVDYRKKVLAEAFGKGD